MKDTILPAIKRHLSLIWLAAFALLLSGLGAGAQTITVDNTAAEYTGTWPTSTYKPNYYGTNYRYNTTGTGADKMRWRPNIATAGTYDVYYWLPNGDSTRASNAPLTIYFNGGTQTYNVDQRANPGGQWVLLGTKPFATGTTGYVELTDNANNDVVIGDAVRFVKADLSAGPTGGHWPATTPAYTTPATKFATPTNINSVLATCVSGDVIEVSGSGTVSATLTGGSQSWAQNVLIRPAIGSRGLAASFNIQAHRVTVAGFHLTAATIGTASPTQVARRSFFARCTLADNTQLLITNADDSGLYEVVAPNYGAGADRMQVRAYGTNASTSNNVIVGCWLKGKWRAIGSGDHSDTVQFWTANGAIAVNNPLIEDSVIFCSSNVSVQVGGGTINGMTWNNVWMNECENKTEQPPAGYEGNGFNCSNSPGNNAACYSSVILGSVGGSSTWDEVLNTVYGTFGPISVASGNTPGQTSTTTYPYPPLPDLSTIWGN